jgi:hypothetical protein
MSTDRMTPYELNQRRLARAFGLETRQFIAMAAPWNRAGERCIERAYENARLAARHARLSIDALERRTRPRRRRAPSRHEEVLSDGGS